MAKSVKLAAEVFETKGAPSITTTFPGHVTGRHQHFFGVLNLLKEGNKVWTVEEPGILYKGYSWHVAGSAADLVGPSPKRFEIEQKPGDLLYLPPGYHHEVKTLENSPQTVSMVTFWMPENCRDRAIAQFQSGIAQENQCENGGASIKKQLGKSLALWNHVMMGLGR